MNLFQFPSHKSVNALARVCAATQPSRVVGAACFLLALVAGLNSADAGFLVGNNPGAGSGNDSLAKVLEEIDEYNAVNNPDLIDPMGLFKKTDDDSAFVFNMANGFMFFSDAGGTSTVTTNAALTSLQTAYFKYSGPQNILFYSVKGPSQFGFSLYTFMPGLNLLDLLGSNAEMSHVSFWSGQPGVDFFGHSIVPEPGSLALLATGGLAAVAARRGRKRRA